MIKIKKVNFGTIRAFIILIKILYIKIFKDYYYLNIFFLYLNIYF